MKKGLLLISGGIDSPVAGYLMRKKGFELVSVHFSNETFTGKEPEIKSRKLSRKIGIKKFISIDVSHVLKEIAEQTEKKYYFVLMKRLMYRLAGKIAEKEKCDFLVTGDNLGQVSSQTLQNMLVIDRAVKIPILRPLIAYDKMEIVKLAEKIGTFDISKGPEMCDVLGPKHPSTQSREDIILKQEEQINIDKIIKNIKL